MTTKISLSSWPNRTSRSALSERPCYRSRNHLRPLWTLIQDFVSLRKVHHSRTLRCHRRATRLIRSDSHLLRTNNSSSNSNSSINPDYLHGPRTEATRTIPIGLISSLTIFPHQTSSLTMTLPLAPRSRVTVDSASQSVHALAKHVGGSRFAASRTL